MVTGSLLARFRQLVQSKMISSKDPEQEGDAERLKQSEVSQEKNWNKQCRSHRKISSGYQDKFCQWGVLWCHFKALVPMAVLASPSSLNKGSVLEYAEAVNLTACEQDSDAACSFGSLFSGLGI